MPATPKPATPKPAANNRTDAPPGTVTDDDLLRYARHLMLEGIGIEGQQALLAAHALVVGAGGLGSPAALYLASAGVGRITLVDHDVVDLTNLQRQVAHTQARLGQPKVQSARSAMLAINPTVQVDAAQARADAAWLATHVRTAQVVLDCSDNYATRQAVNAACVAAGVPLVSGAAVGFAGQVLVADTRHASQPCYACLFAPAAQVAEVDCATLGVFAPLVGVIGALQAGEAIKLLVGLTQPDPAGARLLQYDARSLHFDTLTVPRDAHCPVCAQRPQPETTP